MQDKKIMVTQSSMPPFDEYVELIKKLWDTKWLTNNGEYHTDLQNKLKEYLQCEQITLFVNGHMALEVAIQAMGITGEVITTPFTFASTTHAIVRNGLTPVFCDINLDNYTIDVNKIEELITDKTSAIIPVHVYGQVCDVDAIEKIARKHNLKVIYDAAHVFGVEKDNISIANFGDASMFSFHATKVFNTIEGGALVYSDPELSYRLDLIKNFGIANEESVVVPGTNAKMNEFQAAMGVCNLRHLDEELEKRKYVVNRYRERLSDIKGIKILEEQYGIKENYAYFPVVFDESILHFNRDDVCNKLKENNIFARKYFYPITNEFACYYKENEDSKTPRAKYISERVLTLPLYADLPVKDVDRICNVIVEMIK